MINYINSSILRRVRLLRYDVKDLAPMTETDLFNSSGLVVWAGASDNTIYSYGLPVTWRSEAKQVNHAFRALHDHWHRLTRLDFSPEQEIELGRRQAATFDGIMADLIYCEVAGQAEHYLKTG